MQDLDVHLAAIVNREQQAFAEWMAGAEPAIRRSLSGFAHQVDVESVVQETLLRIWLVAARHQPDGKPNGLLRLAIRIGRNYALDEVRRLRPLRSITEDRAADIVDQGSIDVAPDPLLRRVLLGCLRKLAGRPATALSARLDAGGESDRELAASVGMAVNTFRQNVARGRRAIEACLKRHGVILAEVHK